MAGVRARVAIPVVADLIIAVALVLGALVPAHQRDSTQAWHRSPILDRFLILVLLIDSINAVSCASHEPYKDAADDADDDEGALHVTETVRRYSQVRCCARWISSTR